MDNKTREFIEQLMAWHEEQVNSLKMVTEEHADAPINIDGLVIEPGTDLHNGVRVGVSIALMQLGELPITIKKSEG